MEPFEFNEKNTFCISLEKPGCSRWEKMQKRFEYFDMKVSRWKASVESDLVDSFNPHLSVGQKGCAQSHIHIYRHILENNLDYAMVLEDDACFDKGWKHKLRLFTTQYNDPDWDLIMLNASEPIHPTNQWMICREQYLTGGYIISNRGARRILNDFGGGFCSSDWMTSRLQLNNHSYSYFPWIIIQEGRDSFIGSNLEADREKVKRCLNEIQYSLDHYV
jgi:glycosyl transferase family 25